MLPRILVRITACVTICALFPPASAWAQGTTQSTPPAGDATTERIDTAAKPAISAPTVSPPSAIERLRQLQAALREARGRSDWAASLTAARQIKELLNASAQSRLEFARAEIRAGNPAAAMDELTATVRMGQASNVIDTLPDFEVLRQRKEFADVRASLAANRQPIERSTVAFRIHDAKLLPEDIDFNPRTKRFFLSSVLQHRIVSITGDGSLSEFAKAPDDWPMMAIKIDAKRQRLWATEVAIATFDAVAKSDRGRSSVLCYDLNSGKLLRRVEAPRPTALGDMGLTAQGDVIVSDGEYGGLYRLKADGDRLERLDDGDFISPQTVAMARSDSPAGATHIYVPDYVRGLGVFDLTTKRVRWLASSEQFALNGIDGLYRLGNKLIAIQNGTNPERVAVFSLDSAATKIIAEQIIERASATLGDPTHGVVVEGVFYYIANSGWNALGENGLVNPGATLTEPIVMKWQLTNK